MDGCVMVAVFTASQWRHQLGQASVQFTQLSGTGRPNHHSSRSNKKKAFPNRACSLRRTFRYLVRFLSRTPLVERGFLYVSLLALL
jgi:hypothetical protein